ncbi:hypothetical protein Q7C36_022282 [Tachysurus vachellii]|uniref:ERI1 exoribonuclease 2 n=1 Tax=Tachysurus vachellii TaxID=175792 RepID=A0AA88LMR8_TACVA|nr:hypothetical protein Q7C36_022282 [Tachysurus vachellii]
MSTKKLAKELGIIRKRTPSSSSPAHTLSASNQLFSYLIIIDFESTCWREKNNHGQEIIEFPAVLMNTHTGQIESEFHSYVQPQEHPLLSSFCTELTGITQEQVEAGLPLQICLSRFTRWLHTLQQERDVMFMSDNTQTHTTVARKPCAFLTWSDWDLGVCLQYECKRKQITKPEALNSWIDLRATYRIFYHRKPKGLNGALQDLGIEFSGREHSGLDDARNTARLAWRMISDGCMMKITKSLSRAPLKSGVRGVCADRRVHDVQKEKQSTDRGLHTVTPSHTRGLVSLPTVLSSITPLHTLIVTHTSHPDSSVTHTSHLDMPASDWSEEFVLTEFGDSVSYDDVILEDDSENMPHDSAPVCKRKPRLINSNASCSFEEPVRSLKELNTRTMPTIPFTIYNDQSHQCHSSSSSSSSVFRVPSSVLLSTCNQPVSVNQPACSFIPTNQSKLSSVSVNQPSHSFISINQTRPSCSLNQSSLSSSSTRLSHPSPRNRPEVTSCITKKSTLSSVSLNQSAFSTSSSKRLPLPPLKGGVKITAPLCDCGRRSRRLTVCNGGPNHGRAFYTCSVRRRSDSAHPDSTHPGPAAGGNGCGFFKWESTLINSSVSRNTSALSFKLSTAASRNLR